MGSSSHRSKDPGTSIPTFLGPLVRAGMSVLVIGVAYLVQSLPILEAV
jgi:hypothetical protein